MVFAEFQKNSTGWNGKDFSGPVKPIPALGSDGVYTVDGRLTLGNQIAQAKERAKILPGVIGLIMHSGRNFADAKPITGFIPVSKE